MLILFIISQGWKTITILFNNYLENRMDENLKKEIENRRTFAIISHPDAGKTTLT